MAAKNIGKNVSYEVTKDNKLVITVDLKKTHGTSKSGKTVTIGTSQGNSRAVDSNGDEFIFGLNCYKYPPDEE